MKNLYGINGLIFWTEEEINRRNRFVEEIYESLFDKLETINRSFEFLRVEAPILTPKMAINAAYTAEDIYMHEELALRPETTLGSYSYATHLLSTHNERKIKLPLVVWQHGKSFRREQDQPSKHMRLKEFYQLEFQILFSKTTGKDYYPEILECAKNTLSALIGPCRIEVSDRLPEYSTETNDIICIKNNMEVASISRRKDYSSDILNIELAIGTDRLLIILNTCSKRKNKLMKPFTEKIKDVKTEFETYWREEGITDKDNVLFNINCLSHSVWPKKRTKKEIRDILLKISALADIVLEEMDQK